MKIKVKIALAIDPKGNWNAVGWGKLNHPESDKELMGCAVEHIEDGETRYWLIAELDVPEIKVVEAEVIKDN